MSDLWKLWRSGLFQLLWPALRPFLTKSGRIVFALAIKWVSEAESEDGFTSEEKREWVAQKIRESEEAQDATSSMIYRAIEIALAFVRVQGSVDWAVRKLQSN